MSGYYEELARQVVKYLGGDEARKQRLAVDLAHLGFSMDSAQISQLSSQELAVDALKKLGLKVGSDVDAVLALDFYLAGRRHRAGVALDGGDGASVPNFITNYLKDDAT